MKANKKTIFLVTLAILDCVFGGLVISKVITPSKQEQEKPIKTSGNYVVLDNVFDLSKLPPKEEETKIKEVKKEVKEEKVNKKEPIVYDGMTLNQLSSKLNKSLKSTISGKGSLIASYSLQKGVDPYVATAIMLHETGCEWGCSRLVKECNNVGGQKGSGCGSYAAFSSLDIGIKKFIDNLAKNYYAKGLNTPEKMNKKYATSKTWSTKVNNYVKKIKSR